MSSLAVRTDIKDFLSTNIPSEKFFDMSGRYEFFTDALQEFGITKDDDWVGLDFIGNEEVPITVPATNVQGKYRELGTISIHIVSVARPSSRDSILTRAEVFRNLLRGRRIGTTIIESVTPANFGFGATLSFEAGYISATLLVSYERDLDL